MNNWFIFIADNGLGCESFKGPNLRSKLNKLGVIDGREYYFSAHVFHKISIITIDEE